MSRNSKSNLIAMILVKIATLIGLLLTYVTQATVDLFSNNHGSKQQSFRTSYDTEVSNCETSIVKEFQELNGTGVKVGQMLIAKRGC